MNKNMAKKRALRADLLPPEWKLKRAADFSGRKLKLTPEERQWLDCHEHSHGRREILAVIRGQALLRLAGQNVRLSEGEFLVIEPWVRHTSGHLPDESAVFWWCMLSPGRLSFLLWRRNRIESYQIMKAGDFVRLLDQTLAETAPAAAAELQHWIGALICRFFRTRSDHIPLPGGELHQETVVEKVLAWLDNMTVLKCPLAAAASLAGYSPAHFQRLFRKYTGKSFHDYLQRKRLERYHALRGKSGISKKEIAWLLGFDSTAALIHWERSAHPGPGSEQ